MISNPIYFLGHLALIILYASLVRKLGFSLVISIPLTIAISILPSMQFGFGADYFNYLDLIKDNSPDKYILRGEFLFFYTVKFINYYSLDPKVFFPFVSLIQSILIVNVLRIIHRQGFDVVIVIVLFYIVTSSLQNGMNEIRAYIAIYCFLNAFLYRLEGKWRKSTMFIFLGASWHVSIFIVIPFLLINRKTLNYIYERQIAFFFLFFIFYLNFHLVVGLIELVVRSVFPVYLVYMKGEYIQVNSFNQLFGRLIYLPLYFIFLGLVNLRLALVHSQFSKQLISIYIITGTLYFSSLSFGPVMRIFPYFVFFSIFPIYYVLKSKLSLIIKFLTYVGLLSIFIYKSFVQYNYTHLLN